MALWWLALGSALTFIGTLVLVPILVIRDETPQFEGLATKPVTATESRECSA